MKNSVPSRTPKAHPEGGITGTGGAAYRLRFLHSLLLPFEVFPSSLHFLTSDHFLMRFRMLARAAALAGRFLQEGQTHLNKIDDDVKLSD